MTKKVLLIDNDDISNTIESVHELAAEDADIQVPVKCVHFNPVAREFQNEDREIDFNKSRNALVEILNDKVDVVGCDYNLHETNKRLTFDLINAIRSMNKICTLFIYSGGANRSMLQMFQSEGRKPAEGLLRTALVSRIDDYIQNRGALRTRIVDMIKAPSIELQIEDFITINGALRIDHPFKEFQGKQLSEIAVEIRKQSVLGKLYTKSIIDRGLSHMVDLNS